MKRQASLGPPKLQGESSVAAGPGLPEAAFHACVLQVWLGNSRLFMESEAPPSAGFYNILGWFDANKGLLVKAFAVAAVAGIVIGFVVWRGSQTEQEAEQALSLVPMPFGASEQFAPGTAESLLKVAQEYPKTKAAPKATLRAATVYFDQANFAKAQETFDSFLRAHGDSEWVSQAVFGIAASLDAQGKTAEAIAKYNDFVAKYAGDGAADMARLGLVRLYEQNKQPAQALEVLNKMTASAQPGAFTPAVAEAQEKIREIYKKHPALMPSNPVPAAVSTPMAQLTNLVRSGSNLLQKVTNQVQKILTPQVTPTPGK